MSRDNCVAARSHGVMLHSCTDGIRADIAARVFLTTRCVAPVLAAAHLRRHLRHRRLLRVRHLQRRAARPCPGRPADSSRPAAGVDEPAVLRSSARRVGRPIRSGWPPSRCCRPPRRSTCSSIVLLLVAAHGAYGLARRFGADRPGRGPGGPGLCRLGLHRLPTQAPGHRLHGRLAAGRTAADRSRARRRQRRRRRVRDARCSWRRSASSSRSRCSPAFRSRRTSARWSTARSRCSARSPIDSSSDRWPVRLALLGGLGVATALGAAAGAVVLLPLSELGSVSDRAEALGWEWSTRLAYWPPNVADVPRAVHQRRHLQQHLHRAVLFLGGLRLRRRRDRSCWRSTAAFASGGGRWSRSRS